MSFICKILFKSCIYWHLLSLYQKSALNHFRGARFSTDIYYTYVFIADCYGFHQMITAVRRGTGHQRQKSRQEKSGALHGPTLCLVLWNLRGCSAFFFFLACCCMLHHNYTSKHGCNVARDGVGGLDFDLFMELIESLFIYSFYL